MIHVYLITLVGKIKSTSIKTQDYSAKHMENAQNLYFVMYVISDQPKAEYSVSAKINVNKV